MVNSVDLANHDIFRAKVAKVGILLFITHDSQAAGITAWIQISWFPQKPADLDLHC